jgi:hypothetical protein
VINTAFVGKRVSLSLLSEEEKLHYKDRGSPVVPEEDNFRSQRKERAGNEGQKKSTERNLDKKS